MLGAAPAFASAALLGLNSATLRRAVLKGSVLQGMAITVPLGVPIFVVFALLMGGFSAMHNWPAASWAWMSLAGVTNFVVGRYGNYRSTQALGSALRFSLIFRVFFSGWLNPEHEIIDGRMILAVVVSLLGGLALTIDFSTI